MTRRYHRHLKLSLLDTFSEIAPQSANRRLPYRKPPLVPTCPLVSSARALGLEVKISEIYSCELTREEVEAEAAEAERETEEFEAALQAEIKAYLKTVGPQKRHSIKRRAEKAYDSAMRRAKQKNAVPAWLTDEDKAAILKLYEFAVAREKVTRVPHSVDHIIPLKGVCRKIWRASGQTEYRHVVCGFHVPDNLRVIPLGINRNIKKDWFDSAWLEPPRGGPFGFELPVDGDNEIPF